VNHYYAARETDANFVRMAAPKGKGTEYERDLFYRGVGMFHAPLSVAYDAGDNTIRLSTTESSPLSDLFILTIHDNMARYQRVERIAANDGRTVKLGDQTFAPLSDVREKIMHEVAVALTRQGLYPREALAMVNTWKDQWFAEEGVRVLYLLPRSWTDRTLPLSISPAPDNVVRVMVGRSELITPAVESSLRTQITQYSEGDASTKAVVIGNVRRLGLGRFLDAATRRLTFNNKDKAFTTAAWDVARLASQPGPEQPAVVEREAPTPTLKPVKKTAGLTRADSIAF